VAGTEEDEARGSNSRLIWTLYAVALGSGTLLGVRQLLVPLYADSLGASRATVGLLFSSYTLTAALFALPAGVLLARWGPRRVIACSLSIAVAAQLATAATTQIQLLFVTQAVGGAAQAASQVALMTGAVALAPRGRTGTTVGLVAFFTQSGWLVGPAAGGTLLHWVSMRMDFVLMALPTVAAATVALIALPRLTSGQAAPRLELRRPLRILSRQRGFTSVLLMMFGTTVAWGAFQAYFPLFARRSLGLPVVEVGYILSLQALANGGSRIAGRVFDSVRRKGLLVCAALFGFAAGLELLPHVGGFWPTAILVTVSMTFLGVGFVGVTTTFAQLAPEETRSQALGLFNGIQFFGTGLSPALIAPVMNVDFALGFETLGVVIALVATAALVARRRAVGGALQVAPAKPA
jgi:predicted MFS family arabinose efflux permease